MCVVRKVPRPTPLPRRPPDFPPLGDLILQLLEDPKKLKPGAAVLHAQPERYKAIHEKEERRAAKEERRERRRLRRHHPYAYHDDDERVVVGRAHAPEGSFLPPPLTAEEWEAHTDQLEDALTEAASVESVRRHGRRRRGAPDSEDEWGEEELKLMMELGEGGGGGGRRRHGRTSPSRARPRHGRHRHRRHHPRHARSRGAHALEGYVGGEGEEGDEEGVDGMVGMEGGSDEEGEGGDDGVSLGEGEFDASDSSDSEAASGAGSVLPPSHVRQLTPEEERAEYLWRFYIMRKKYGDQHPIPDIFNEHSDLDTMKRAYERTKREIGTDANVHKYQKYLMLMCMAVEYVGCNLLKKNFSGFTKAQAESMSSYNELLYELGEKKAGSGGSNVPVELRLCGMILMNAGLFFVANSLPGAKGALVRMLTGQPLAASPEEGAPREGGAGATQTPPPQRPMRGPTLPPGV